MAEILSADTVWYLGQLIVIVAVCLTVTVVVVAFLATLKLCIQLCGMCNTVIVNPSLYLYDKGYQLYELYRTHRPPVYVEEEAI